MIFMNLLISASLGCHRAGEWRPLESVLFIADARVSWKTRAVTVQVCAKTVITHQPHTADAEALRLHIRNQATARESLFQF